MVRRTMKYVKYYSVIVRRQSLQEWCNFSQSRPRCWKSGQIQQWTGELSAKKSNKRNAISCAAENANAMRGCLFAEMEY